MVNKSLNAFGKRSNIDRPREIRSANRWAEKLQKAVASPFRGLPGNGPEESGNCWFKCRTLSFAKKCGKTAGNKPGRIGGRPRQHQSLNSRSCLLLGLIPVSGSVPYIYNGPATVHYLYGPLCHMYFGIDHGRYRNSLLPSYYASRRSGGWITLTNSLSTRRIRRFVF